ncbi:MAG: hypothetical protein HY392_02820 [Candidatus Diapherotrites archaeon]|nr:hypothetical protein [Candidatus Diapherotrites archaeon]
MPKKIPLARRKKKRPLAVNPQTGEPFLGARAIKAIEAGEKARLLGRIGEELVHEMYPHWVPAAPNQEGYDFIKPSSRGDVKIEVKTLSLEAALSRKIHFLVQQGHWHNQAAHKVMIVSPLGVHELDATSLRKFIRNHLAQFPALEHLSYQRGQKVWIEVGLDRLLGLKIGRPANVNPSHCRDFFLEKLGLKQPKGKRKT